MAVPCPLSDRTINNQEGEPFQPGTTLRDYFAAAALQGLLANPDTQNSIAALSGIAFTIADAMLAAREKGSL
jgi:hypothetical protein